MNLEQLDKLIQKIKPVPVKGVVFHDHVKLDALDISSYAALAANLQGVSAGIHPRFMGHTHVNTSHPGIDDLDDAGACNLTEIERPVVKFTIDGVEQEMLGKDDDFRYVVYDKQIQYIRNVESFVSYHKSHPGSMQRILTNMVWAQFLAPTRLTMMYNNCRSNQDYERPTYYDKNQRAWMKFQPMRSEVPMNVLVELSNRWVQGLAIEIFGAKAFDMIKKAKEEAAKKLAIQE